MLIITERHTRADLERWKTVERNAQLHARLRSFGRRVAEAEREALAFTQRGPCYCGVSWGKDSVCVADIVMRVAPSTPLVWVRVRGVENPDCPMVRDEFLKVWPEANYHEVTTDHTPASERRHGQLTSTTGFERAAEMFGDRYISGIRANESRARKMRLAIHGFSTARTCAPLSRWTARDVFAYLHAQELPVHPAYGYLMGGLLDPALQRVAALGGSRGEEFGRTEWERRYYPQEMRSVT